jgi:hypothetical protein
MKPSEMTNELLTRINRTTRVIQESLAEYGGITPDPLNDQNDSISNHSFPNFKKQYIAMMFSFFKMNLFKAALTPELWSIVAQQDQEAMTIKKMYQVATKAKREDKSKSMATVSKIRDEEISAEPEDNKNNVAAFNRRGARPKMNSGSQSNCSRYASSRGSYQAGSRFNKQGGLSGGNNANRNNKYCYFCKQQGHRQEECRKRTKENKPCRDAQG